jgi:hypothetical protein
MSEKTPHTILDPNETEELVPQDDAIIGHAMRRSAQVAGVLLLVVGALYFLLTREPPKPAEQKIKPAAPEAPAAKTAELPSIPFRDITGEAGIAFVHESGATGEKLLPESMGGGAAFLDYDGDGDQDLLLVSGASWPGAAKKSGRTALYQNDGKGRFRDVTAEAGLGAAAGTYGMGVAVGDYDADGYPDFYLTALGKNRLFKNRGGKGFEDVTGKMGVAGGEDEWSTSAAFADFDRDGDLDLFVANYVLWSREIDLELDYRLVGVGRAYGPPVNYKGQHARLFRNDGAGFADVSKEAGVQVLNKATGVAVAKALGVLPVDIEGDADLDILVANDTTQNFLFVNDGKGVFEERGEEAGIAYGRAGESTGAMGIDGGHYRNDRDLGIAIGNFANEMTSLYISQGNASLFSDEAISDGVGAPSRLPLKFGMLFADFDLDGRLDLLQTNGHLETEIAQVDPSQTYAQPAQFFWNAGPGARATFVELKGDHLGDLVKPIVGRGSAFADIDGDGDLDVVMTQVGRAPLLLRNDLAAGANFLRLRLADPKSANRDAIGARVTIEAGGVRQERQVMPTRSYLSQSEPTLTFGLGKIAKVDSVKVIWPDGKEETLDPAAYALGRENRVERR